MEPDEATSANDYIQALSELLASCLHQMLEEGNDAGAFEGMEKHEVECYIAALCIRGGLSTLNQVKPEGDVLTICHSIMSTAIIDVNDDETIH